ncbi:hypothetical protein DFAR_2770012 [Desulfarculales bacterium]
MNPDLLERAHRLYALEGDCLERLLSQEPAFGTLNARLEMAKAHMLASGGRDPQQTQAVQEAWRLLLEMSRKTAFTLGFIMARTHTLGCGRQRLTGYELCQPPEATKPASIGSACSGRGGCAPHRQPHQLHHHR